MVYPIIPLFTVFHSCYPLVNCPITTMERSTISMAMDKSTISMAMFNSFLYVYQRVSTVDPIFFANGLRFWDV